MIFQPHPFLYFVPLSVFAQNHQPQYSLLNQQQNYSSKIVPQNFFLSTYHSDSEFSEKIQNLSAIAKKNSTTTNQIINLLTVLEKKFQTMEEDINSISFGFENLQKESSSLIYTNDCFSQEKNQIDEVKNNRTHPKVKLMEKIFGKKQYKYKLAYDGKFPKILFKQRNISLKILLKTLSGNNVINGNQISLNLKVFKNNGEQILSDCPQAQFMQGLCQTQIQNGVGMFSKIHPRQVSRGFSGKGICIIIYATSQQNQASKQGLNIHASQIQPLIFYNIKVVVKQNKMIKKISKQSSLIEDD